MSEAYWDGDWPNLNSVGIFLPVAVQWTLSPAAVGVIYRLAAHIAIRSVHTAYQDPKIDPSFPADEKEIRRIAGCSRKEYREALPYFDMVFSERDGRWRISDETVLRFIKPSTRTPISAMVKAAIVARDGGRCVYCGSVAGPFHFDHLFPLSRGGSNEVSNLVLACATCNRAKSDMTLAEWFGVCP